MEIIYFLLPASIVLALIGLIGFIWAVRKGQFEDLDTPDKKILFENDGERPAKPISDPDH